MLWPISVLRFFNDWIIFHWLDGITNSIDGREFEWTPGVGDGQGGLGCCNSWGHKESDMTEQLNWIFHCVDMPHFIYPFIHWWTFGLFPLFYSKAILLRTSIHFLCVDIYFHFFWGTAGLPVTLCLRKHLTIFQSSCTILYSFWCTRVTVSLYSCQLLSFWLQPSYW